MKCPLCNAPTDVKLTRLMNGQYVRTRECFNEHTFRTAEIAITDPTPKRKYKRDTFTQLTKRIKQ